MKINKTRTIRVGSQILNWQMQDILLKSSES